jgi:hypothetical protein
MDAVTGESSTPQSEMEALLKSGKRKRAAEARRRAHAKVQSRSLYSTDAGSPTLKDSFLLYVDELGAKDRIASLTDADLVDWLSLRDLLSDFLHSDELRGQQRMLAFSDNIVVGAPLDPAQEDGGLFWQIWGLATYQVNVSLRGLWIRGAITRGPLYMDDTVVTGQALVDADRIEKTQAVFPRILIDPSCYEFLLPEFHFEADPFSAPVNRYVLIDEGDDTAFVNYLPAVLEDEQWVLGVGEQGLARHAQAVSAGLAASQGDAKVGEKMLWLVDYHNYICDEFLFMPHHKITVPGRRRTREFSLLLPREQADEMIASRRRERLEH